MSARGCSRSGGEMEKYRDRNVRIRDNAWATLIQNVVATGPRTRSDRDVRYATDFSNNRARVVGPLGVYSSPT